MNIPGTSEPNIDLSDQDYIPRSKKKRAAAPQAPSVAMSSLDPPAAPQTTIPMGPAQPQPTVAEPSRLKPAVPATSAVNPGIPRTLPVTGQPPAPVAAAPVPTRNPDYGFGPNVPEPPAKPWFPPRKPFQIPWQLPSWLRGRGAKEAKTDWAAQMSRDTKAVPRQPLAPPTVTAPQVTPPTQPGTPPAAPTAPIQPPAIDQTNKFVRLAQQRHDKYKLNAWLGIVGSAMSATGWFWSPDTQDGLKTLRTGLGLYLGVGAGREVSKNLKLQAEKSSVQAKTQALLDTLEKLRATKPSDPDPTVLAVMLPLSQPLLDTQLENFLGRAPAAGDPDTWDAFESMVQDQLRVQLAEAAVILIGEKQFKYFGEVAPLDEEPKDQTWKDHLNTSVAGITSLFKTVGQGLSWAGESISHPGNKEGRKELAQQIPAARTNIIKLVGKLLKTPGFLKAASKSAAYIGVPLAVGGLVTTGFLAPVFLGATYVGVFAARAAEAAKRLHGANNDFEAAKAYAQANVRLDESNELIKKILEALNLSDDDKQKLTDEHITDAALSALGEKIRLAGDTGALLVGGATAITAFAFSGQNVHAAEPTAAPDQPADVAAAPPPGAPEVPEPGTTAPVAEPTTAPIIPVPGSSPVPAGFATPDAYNPSTWGGAPSPGSSASPALDPTRLPSTTPGINPALAESTTAPGVPAPLTPDFESGNFKLPSDTSGDTVAVPADGVPAPAPASPDIAKHAFIPPTEVTITSETELGNFSDNSGKVSLDILGTGEKAEVYTIQTNEKTGLHYIEMNYLDADGNGKAEKLTDGSFVRLYIDAKSSHGTMFGEHFKTDGSIEKVYAVDKDTWMTAEKGSGADAWEKTRAAHEENSVSPGKAETKGWGFVPRTGVLAQVGNSKIPEVMQVHAAADGHPVATLHGATIDLKQDLAKLSPLDEAKEIITKGDLRFEDHALEVTNITIPLDPNSEIRSHLDSFVNFLTSQDRHDLPSTLREAFSSTGSIGKFALDHHLTGEQLKEGIKDALVDTKGDSKTFESFGGMVSQLEKSLKEMTFGASNLIPNAPGTAVETGKITETVKTLAEQATDPSSDLAAYVKTGLTKLNDAASTIEAMTINQLDERDFVRVKIKGDDVIKLFVVNHIKAE